MKVYELRLQGFGKFEDLYDATCFLTETGQKVFSYITDSFDRMVNVAKEYVDSSLSRGDAVILDLSGSLKGPIGRKEIIGQLEGHLASFLSQE